MCRPIVLHCAISLVRSRGSGRFYNWCAFEAPCQVRSPGNPASCCRPNRVAQENEESGLELAETAMDDQRS